MRWVGLGGRRIRQRQHHSPWEEGSSSHSDVTPGRALLRCGKYLAMKKLEVHRKVACNIPGDA